VLDVNFRNSQTFNETSLSLALKWRDIPAELLEKIKEASANEAKENYEDERLQILEHLTV
jgi:hypothetical protein